MRRSTLRLLGRPLAPALGDGSTLLTAWLFALCLPPLAPWWIAAIGMLTAVVLAKQLYGGLGHNLFNPAMAGYALVLVAFPLELSRWPEPFAGPGLGAALAAILGSPPPAGWDALVEATPLDRLRQLTTAGLSLGEAEADPALGPLLARPASWIALAHLGGGLLLLALRATRWQVPLAAIATALVLTTPPWLLEPDRHPSPLHHLLSGAFILGAFFIATDPVSGASTPRGRLIFGAGFAVLTLAIRRFGQYPDGVAFAVLILNAFAPLLDRLAAPRIFGRRR
ncbi:MAG: RnfABCDGE type electron transport complex subunit D [Xanthomonadales bacterium]|nr:RnfABCDGE type electron transport complex subunit D [Xanthomonadales bacterium]